MYRLYKPCINPPFWDCAMYFDDGIIQSPLKQPFSRPRSCHACHGPCTECCWQCCNGCRIRPNSRSAGVLRGCLPKQKIISSSKHHTRKSGFSRKKNVDCMFWWWFDDKCQHQHLILSLQRPHFRPLCLMPGLPRFWRMAGTGGLLW